MSRGARRQDRPWWSAATHRAAVPRGITSGRTELRLWAGLMVIWPLPVSATLAIMLALVELWHTADRFWPSGGWWSFALLAADASTALLVTYASPAFLPHWMDSRSGEILLLAVISGGAASRPLLLCPVHGAPMTARRLITIRRFMLLEIDQRARSARTRYLLEAAYPAAATCGEELSSLTKILLRDWERTRKQRLDEHARTVMRSGPDISYPIEVLMPILIKYGGLSICSELVRRSKGAAPEESNSVSGNTRAITASLPSATGGNRVIR